ncbi:MAG: hypothetical protein QOI94_2629 [Acidobacteriaceae bacterium]|nr:hypothetical protein [Acidobacteriaceae bacterium]
MTLPDTSTAANQTAGPYWDAAGWCSFGRQARCTRLMYRFAQTKLYANRLVETKETDRIVYRALHACGALDLATCA